MKFKLRAEHFVIDHEVSVLQFIRAFESYFHHMALLADIKSKLIGFTNKIVGAWLHINLNQGLVVSYRSPGFYQVEIMQLFIQNEGVLLAEG